MKKYQAVLLALLAVFAVAAVTAGAASAETTLLAEWLVNGVGVAAGTTVPSKTTGELILTVLVLGIAGSSIKCSGIFVGTLGANGADEVTELLNLAEEKIGSELVGLALVCLTVSSTIEECGPVGSEADVWADELPWKTLLVLMEPEATFLDWFLNGGYHIACLAGKKLEDLCGEKTLTSALLANVAGGVSGEFNSSSESVKCTLGEGMQESPAGNPGLTTTTTGSTLTVSE